MVETAEALLGEPVVPFIQRVYFGESGWHCDDGIGVTKLKVALYLQPSPPPPAPSGGSPSPARPALRVSIDHESRAH